MTGLPPDWVTLKDLDEAAGRPKGSAFRAFKALLGELREGTDFVRLDADRDAPAIAALKASNRLYASSIHAVLLSGAAAGRVRALVQNHDAFDFHQ